MHGITLATAGRNGTFVGAVLAGGDRLQFHRWVLDALLQLGPSSPGYGGSLAYANRQLAPFTIIGNVLGLNYHDALPPVQMPGGTTAPLVYSLDKRLLEANLLVSREFYGAPSALGFTFIDDNQPGEPTLAFTHRRAAGPFLAASYVGVESTPYSDVRRALALSTSLAYFPGGWNTADASIFDAGAEITAVTPLPLSRRHSLRLDVRGRDLFGSPPGANWLQVGGGLSALVLTRRPNLPAPDEVDIPSLPTQVRFFEPLRGYEDLPIITDRILIAEAEYFHPFIIDWGTASTFAILPAFFLRQIDLELFGTAATSARGYLHAAAGGSLSLRMALWTVPISVTYQIARRLEDDHALVQLLALTLQ
jgi:hypothetical protein